MKHLPAVLCFFGDSNSAPGYPSPIESDKPHGLRTTHLRSRLVVSILHVFSCCASFDGLRSLARASRPPRLDSSRMLSSSLDGRTSRATAARVALEAAIDKWFAFACVWGCAPWLPADRTSGQHTLFGSLDGCDGVCVASPERDKFSFHLRRSVKHLSFPKRHHTTGMRASVFDWAVGPSHARIAQDDTTTLLESHATEGVHEPVFHAWNQVHMSTTFGMGLEWRRPCGSDDVDAAEIGSGGDQSLVQMSFANAPSRSLSDGPIDMSTLFLPTATTTSSTFLLARMVLASSREAGTSKARSTTSTPLAPWPHPRTTSAARPVMVIGSAGCGKTSTVRAMLALCHAIGVHREAGHSPANSRTNSTASAVTGAAAPLDLDADLHDTTERDWLMNVARSWTRSAAQMGVHVEPFRFSRADPNPTETGSTADPVLCHTEMVSRRREHSGWGGAYGSVCVVMTHGCFSGEH